MMLGQISQDPILRAVIVNLLNREVQIVVARERRLLSHNDQLPALLIGQRAQQHAIYHAEDRRVHANAQRQRQNRQQREPRIAAQYARAKPYVLPDRFERAVALDIAALFFESLNPAKPAQGRLERLFRAHPAPHVLFGLHLQMEAQLALHLPLRPFDPEQRAQFARQTVWHTPASSCLSANRPARPAQSPPTTAASSRSLLRVAYARRASACNTLPGACCLNCPIPPV